MDTGRLGGIFCVASDDLIALSTIDCQTLPGDSESRSRQPVEPGPDGVGLAGRPVF